MRIFVSKTILVAFIVCFGCTVIAILFWSFNGGYRAVSPLVFILGVAGAYFVLKGKIRNPLRRQGLSRSKLEKLFAGKSFEKQKIILWKQGIPELIARLYIRHIRYYPEWKHTAKEAMPSSVTAAVETKNKQTKIILYFNEYEFNFKNGYLEISAVGKKVFGLQLKKHEVDYRERWDALRIETFLYGPWLRDFQKLGDEIAAIKKAKEQEARED